MKSDMMLSKHHLLLTLDFKVPLEGILSKQSQGFSTTAAKLSYAVVFTKKRKKKFPDVDKKTHENMLGDAVIKTANSIGPREKMGPSGRDCSTVICSNNKSKEQSPRGH